MANFDDSIVLEGESSSDVFGNWKPISRTDTHVKKIAEFGVKEHEQTMIFNQVEAGLVGNRMLMDNEKYYILVILAQNSLSECKDTLAVDCNQLKIPRLISPVSKQLPVPGFSSTPSPPAAATLLSSKPLASWQLPPHLRRLSVFSLPTTHFRIPSTTILFLSSFNTESLIFPPYLRK
ncbi:hypothetical protein Csa_003201 [Cucumis sativus]|nr:hypothetical protein Csa_003201 [Cucumis sativus]